MDAHYLKKHIIDPNILPDRVFGFLEQFLLGTLPDHTYFSGQLYILIINKSAPVINFLGSNLGEYREIAIYRITAGFLPPDDSSGGIPENTADVPGSNIFYLRYPIHKQSGIVQF